MKRAYNIDSEMTLKNYERELKLCQKYGGDINRYRRLSFNVLQLEQIRLGLEHGIDPERYTDPSLSWIEMECIREMEESGFDMSGYIKDGFTWLQCAEILAGKKKGLDVSVYANKDILDDQMREIRKGLEKKVDVSLYANPVFDSYQMREVRRGLELGLDAKKYASPEFLFITMRALRKALEKGYDLVPYAKKGYGGKELMELTRGLVAGNPDIRGFFEKGYNAEQLEQINNAFEAGVNLLPYLSIKMYGAQLAEIVKGLIKKVDVSIYAKGEYNWFQMREMRYGLEDKVDVSSYANPMFTYRQMGEVRKGLLAGVDVSRFAKVYYEPEQMEQMRNEILNEEPEVQEEDLKILEEKPVASKPIESKPSAGKPAENKSVASKPAETKPVASKPAAAKPAESAASDSKKKPEAPKAKSPAAEKVDVDLPDLPDVDLPKEEIGEEQPEEEFDPWVIVSEDKMKVYLHLAPKEDGTLYSEVDIAKMLRHKGVKQGVMKERIQEVIQKKLYDKDILIAEGREAEDGKDGSFQYYFRRNLKRKPKVLENGVVDYKNMDFYETVKKDQLLAEYEPPTKGKFGYDVTGQLLPPKPGKELPPLHGEGFSMSDDRKQYFSLIDGIVELENDEKLTVKNLLVITGDVDTSTGNIVFDGDVNITGSVLSGFTVEATGNVLIDGRCEGCQVKAGKDIVIRKGCQGQEVGVLEAGGSLTGQFFESAKIKAKEDIEASYLLNCDVRTAGMLKVQGRRGVIIGGYVCAKQGIDCFGIGTVAEVKTVLEVGIDQEDMTAYQEITKNINKLESEIKSLEEGVVKLMAIPNKDEEKTNFFNRITKALYTKKSQRKEMQQNKHDMAKSLTKQRGAKIVVSGLVYPGTKLFINTEPYVVKQECRNVQFVKQDSGIVVG